MIGFRDFFNHLVDFKLVAINLLYNLFQTLHGLGIIHLFHIFLSYELRATSYELRVTSYELQVYH